jgi:hypothetical protein
MQQGQQQQNHSGQQQVHQAAVSIPQCHRYQSCRTSLLTNLIHLYSQWQTHNKLEYLPLVVKVLSTLVCMTR